MKGIADFFKVLADETRVAMLWLLFNQREICVCDLMEVLGITQSKASRHLATLRHAGLVVDRPEGTWTYYSLRLPNSAFELSLLETLRAGLSQHPNAVSLLDRLKECIECRCRGAANERGHDRRT